MIVLPRGLALALITLTVALGLMPGTSRAQTPHSTQISTPDALIEQALANHPDLAAAGLSADAARALAPRARALPEPRLDMAWFASPILTARGAQRTRVSLMQDVPWPGIRSLRAQSVHLDADRMDLETLLKALDIIRDVQVSWDDAWRAQTLIRHAREFQRALATFEQAAIVRYEVGSEAMAPLLGIQLESQALDIQIERLHEEEIDARRRLARLADRPSLMLPDSLAPRPTDAPRTDLIPSRHPAVLALETQAEERRLQVDLSRLGARPDFMVGFDWVAVSEDPVMARGDGRDAFAVRAGISIPLWGAARRAPQERAQLALAEVDERIRALETALVTDVRSLAERLDAQERQIRLLEDTLLPRAVLARDTAQSAYIAGRISLLQALESERMLYRLQVQLVDARARFTQTRAHYDRAVAAHSGS
ncbi:MAG: TolC family protein [Rhodothermales bacterium]